MHKSYQTIIKNIAPIHSYELARFLCIATLMFLISYIHTILHISKDVVIISHLGTESISAVKIWMVLPISLALMFGYIKLSDKLTRSQLFHTTTWFILSYFIIFSLVLYPHREALIIPISNPFIAKLPSLRYLFKIISNWHYSLFDVFSEIWITLMLPVSFWQTANHITTIEESKRFYPLFGIAAGIGKMTASFLSAHCAANGSNWQPTLNHITILIVGAGVAISICVIVLENIIGKDIFNLKKSHFKVKNKISLKESLKYIASSKIILFITLILFCYNMSINLVEGVWKKSIEVFFGSGANQIHYFMSTVDFWVSIISISCAFVGIYILRTFKWVTSALITPVMVLITGGVFFLFMLVRNGDYFIFMNYFSLSMTAVAVYIGAFYNVFCRASKYTLFDPTKERVYIPLDDDLKTKGKAAAETIGMRFGKGGGAFTQQILLALFPTLTLLDLSTVIFGIFLITALCWFYSTIALSRSVKV